MAVRTVRALIIVLTTGLFFTPAIAADTIDPSNETVWRFVDVEIQPENPTAGTVATVRFTIEDQDGQPVSELRASGLLRAPSTANDSSPPTPTLTTIGRELGDPGRYEVAVALNQQGRWWIEARVEDQSGKMARYDHFTIVDAEEDTAPASTSEPLFLRGDEWDAYYRIDPDTGSVATIDGDDLFKVANNWWIANTRLENGGTISSDYGGTWTLKVDLRDAISGVDITTIDIGDIRANVYSGSSRDPAIASSVAIPEDGSAAYIYWARQLGEGWVGRIAEADPLTGEIRNESVINGAIASNGFWAEIYVVDDEHLAVAEQVVQGASVSGYRLSLLERGSLDRVAQYRHPEAGDDPLTHCMLAYPGPIGGVSDMPGTRYSLCSPPNSDSDLSLVVWSAITGRTVHSVDLEEFIGDDTRFTVGVASPDRSSFYAVNSRTMRVAEIDMRAGEVVRERNLLPDDDADPSTLDRIFDWVFGATSSSASAFGGGEAAVTISADGETLYVVATPESREPGVLVIDLDNLEIVNSLMTGEFIDGLIATEDNRIAMIERNGGSDGDTVTVMDNDGSQYLTFMLPGRSDILGSRR